MNKKLLINAALCLFITSAAMAQDSEAFKKIKDEGLNHSKVMETAFYLTDVSGPRLSNSPGLQRAQAWAAQQMKTYGLQNVKLEPWGKFGKGWEIEKYYAAMTSPYYHNIIASPKAWTPSTNGLVKSEIVLLKIDSLSDLNQYKGKLKDKIVLSETSNALETSFKSDGTRYTDEELADMAKPQEAGAGGRAPRDASFMERYRKLRELRDQTSAFLKEEGVTLVLTYARGIHGTFFTSNGASYAEDAPSVLPELEMGSEDFLRLQRLLKAGIKVAFEADIKTKFFDKDLTGYNVIGEIPGSDPKLKDEVVMIGGHLDSWHAATGATDNAAGCAVMMEAMRVLKASGLKPSRTVRVALWSSEEQGLFGSRNYVLQHFGNPKTMELKPEQNKLVAYYNLDNGTGKIRGVYLQGNEAAGPIFADWLKPFNAMGASAITPRNTGGTDHLSFDALGIPGFQFIQDGMEYFSRTHHSNEDTFDRLSEDDLKQAATIVASFVYNTSEMKTPFPRKELPKAQ
nr:M20/M25/M40 family metallo-hydrolase [Pseudopedobacter sp.]